MLQTQTGKVNEGEQNHKCKCHGGQMWYIDFDLIASLPPPNNFIRASTIISSQLAIRIKIVYYYLVEGERRREKESELLCKSQL
jgi:hypothetical protein